MTNNLNEKRSYAVIIAAVICTLAIMIGGLTTGLVFAVRSHNETAADEGRQMARFLLEEAADSLRHSMSALRLCNEKETADEINRTALVYAVRAETSLECHTDDWADSRSKEAFLNDISTVLHSYEPEKTIEISDTLYNYSAKFYESIISGETFEYDGELVKSDAPEEEQPTEVTQEQIDSAAKIIADALQTTNTEYIGAWSGHIEFYIERNGKTGYAVVCADKITEYSFLRSDEWETTDVETAKRLALETAEKCGYPGLTVKWSEQLGKSVGVIMCKSYAGALATDDYATAVVYNSEVVAFSSGGCDNEHKDIPSPKKSESEARLAAKDGGEGVLTVRTVNGKERICYEYRYELDDGVHFVYVCAENGKQMQVK